MARSALCGLVLSAFLLTHQPSVAQTPASQPRSPGAVAATQGTAAESGATGGMLEINENNFLLLDRNQNGVIELDEDFAGIPMLREQFVPQLQQLDADGDGRVTREEFFGKAKGGSWRPTIAVLLGLIGFAGLCLAVDGVLDKTRRVLVLPGIAAAAIGIGLVWLVHAELVMELFPAVVASILIAVGTLGMAVALGKPVEEREVEFLPTLQGGPGKRYVIGKGGKLLGVQTGSTKKPARPQRQPRRPPT